MSKKKVNYNSCYVSGEVIDIRDARILGNKLVGKRYNIKWI